MDGGQDQVSAETAIIRVSPRYVDAPYALAYVDASGRIVANDFPERRFDEHGKQIPRYETIRNPKWDSAEYEVRWPSEPVVGRLSGRPETGTRKTE